MIKHLRKHLRGGGIYLAHSFRGFSLLLADCIVSGPSVKQNIMVEGYVGAEIFNSWQPGSRERK
jgi:hypothetical protein